MAQADRFGVIKKAALLFQQGAVTRLSADVYEVVGTHARYVVDRLAGDWRCSCPAGRAGESSRVCSHVLAAAYTALAQQHFPELTVRGRFEVASAALGEITTRVVNLAVKA